MPVNRTATRCGSRLLAVVNRVRSKPPPMWLVHRVVNPLMRRLLPTRVGRMLPGVAVLRFRGRRTGAARAVPVGIYDHEGAQVVFSDSPWAANFRGGAPLEVVRRGHTTAAYGELVHDPHYVGPAIRAVLRAGASKTMLGVAIERGHLPTDDELAAVRAAVVIREPRSE
jgi:hypothetical protein